MCIFKKYAKKDILNRYFPLIHRIYPFRVIVIFARANQFT